MTVLKNRFTRQQDIVPRGNLTNLKATVIGVGAIGRQVAIQLASIGVQNLQLIDFDTVEETNITTQGYLGTDLGSKKVAATSKFIEQIDPSVNVEVVEDRFRPTLDVGHVVFCCVDSITTRSTIWKYLGASSYFWCDGRMLGELIRVLTVSDKPSREHYMTTLFDQSNAHTGSCTSRSTIYTSSIAAGLMVHQFTRWLRGIAVDSDLSVNLLASEITSCD